VALVVILLVLVKAVRRFQRFALDVGQLVDAAERIEAGDYSVQLRERGPREVRQLIRTFNAMAARLSHTERTRRAYVADLTHELRTPLAVIRGQAEGIGDGLYPGDQAHVAPILDATQSLENLIEALPTLALADVGGLRLKRESIELPVLINSTLASFQALADAAHVQLKSELTAALPTIEADPARIRSVLMNLLSNALRYTPAGGSVTVGARSAGDRVTISVRDTGKGIPEEMRPRIFDRFVKGADSPGAGLGLAISKDIVTAHGGTIEAWSAPGGGTEVSFTLPLRDPQGRRGPG
jgi:signal transduction histidine kinase